MIRYKLYQEKRESSVNKGMWYARAVPTETVDLEKLAKHMAGHNSPFSAGTIKGLLDDMITCVKELVMDGKAVKLPDLAIFSLAIDTKAAPSPKEFTPAENIKGAHLLARATGDLSTRALRPETRFREYTEYAPAEGGAVTQP